MSQNLMAFLKSLIARERFNPRIIGFFINPYFFIRRGLYRGIQSHASKFDGKLLDFGCGTKPYRDLFVVDEYMGVDIEVSGNHNGNKSVDIYYDGKELPFEDGQFDNIFSSEVFEHVFNINEVLKELNRVCKSKGKLLVTVPFVWDEHEIPYDFGRYTSYGITHLLEQHGFDVLELEKSTTYVQTVFQMWNAYIFQHILINRILKAVFTPILITPFTILGSILSFALPSKHGFYNNNIVLAQKSS